MKKLTPQKRQPQLPFENAYEDKKYASLEDVLRMEMLSFCLSRRNVSMYKAYIWKEAKTNEVKLEIALRNLIQKWVQRRGKLFLGEIDAIRHLWDLKHENVEFKNWLCSRPVVEKPKSLQEIDEVWCWMFLTGQMSQNEAKEVW